MSLPTTLFLVWGKMLYLPIPTFLLPKSSGRFGTIMEGAGKGTPGRTILTNKICMCPHDVCGGSGPHWTKEGCRGNTVDGKPACPVAPHPTSVAVSTCQGSCLGKGHSLWWGLIEWHKENIKAMFWNLKEYNPYNLMYNYKHILFFYKKSFLWGKIDFVVL